MKSVTVLVREDYSVPRLFQSGDGSEDIREAALTIGASAIEEVLRIDLQKQGDKSQELAESRQRLEQVESSLNEAVKSQKITRERQKELLASLAKQQQEHDEEMTKMRREMSSRVEVEREKILSEIQNHTKRDADQAVREAILAERERQAAERDLATSRSEERHALMMANLEKRHLTSDESTRKTLELLRAEHEGLTLKLMARLEPGTQRVGSSSSLGRTFEANVATHLRNVFGARPGFVLEDVHATGHSGDLLMVFDGLRILVELKSYDPKTRVPTKEVEKLARDLAEVQPPCDAGIMISACSEITGHYSCGPLEVSSEIARVPILFINNFLSLGEPMVTLHMTRVFLSMVQARMKGDDEPEVGEEAERMAECARRCTSYLTELSKQSAEMLRQVTIMKTTAIKLRETVISFVETEVARYNGIMQLMTRRTDREEAVVLDRTVFMDPSGMSPAIRKLAVSLTSAYAVGDHRQQCPTKEIIMFIQSMLNIKSEKASRDALKSMLLESVVKHGYIVGIARKVETPIAEKDDE